MVTVTFELPEDVLSLVRKDPERFTQELRLAAVKRYACLQRKLSENRRPN